VETVYIIMVPLSDPKEEAKGEAKVLEKSRPSR
jgi:hypothetical protein